MRELDEIVFRNKNRSYGAYLLRRKQHASTVLALFLSVFLFSSVFFGMMVYYALPEEMLDDDWIEYDQQVVTNPFQSDYILEEPPGGHKKVNETTDDISVDPEVTDVIFADVVNTGIDSSGRGADSIAGIGQQLSDTTDRSAFTVSKDPSVIYNMLTRLDALPAFPGGEKARVAYFHAQIKYPKLAIDNKIQGVVYVNFIVEPDSSISNIQILQGIGAGCDDEAMRAVRGMPQWTPGRKDGRAVRVQVTMPLTFTMTASN